MEPSIFDVAAPIGVERLGRHLGGIPEGRTRLMYLRERVEAAPELPLVRLLACAQREAAAGSYEGRICVESFGGLVAEGLLTEELRARLAARADEICEAGVRLLVEPPVEARGKDSLRVPKGSLAADGETLGRRKQLARTATGDLLDRILQDPHPDVIRNALLNPRMSEALAVRVAARRPVPGAVLEVVSQSKFRRAAAVKRALVMNPNCPVQVACQLVASLTRSDLLMVAHAEGLASEVRDTARLLLDAKPPKHPGDA